MPRWRWTRSVAGLSAVLLSVAAHFILLERFPLVSLGRMLDLEVIRTTRAFQLRKIDRVPVQSLEQPPPFSAENSGYTPSIPEEVASTLGRMQPVLPELEYLALPMNPSDVVPVAGFPQPGKRSAWEPRRDILVIEDARVSEELAALPRLVIPAGQLVEEGPDVGMPEPPTLQSTVTTISGEALRFGPAFSARRPHWAFSGGHLAGAGPPFKTAPVEGEEIPRPDRDETSPIGNPEEIVPYKPVEQLLELTVATLQAPDEPGITYFRIQVSRKPGATMRVLPRDVLVLQDCSESMTQRKLNACKKGLHAILDRMNDGDRLELIAFREGVVPCFGRFEPLSHRERAKANTYIESLQSLGKTDVFASLKALMDMGWNPYRPLIAILVTDGRPTTGLVDSSDIISTFTQNNAGHVSVFAVGGGKRVNRFLLDLLSYRNRGDARVEEKREEIPGAMLELADGLQRPVMMDLHYRFTGIDSVELFPETLTHLYLDRPLEIYGRFYGDPPPSRPFR